MLAATLEKHYCRLLHELLTETKGSFVSVSEMAEHLQISVSDTLDALIILKRKNQASQGINGWNVQ
jgi:hypothetical protein